MSTRRTYDIGENRLTIDVGSVLDVSAAIRMAAGNALVLDASKAVPRELGDVVVTTAGALPARYVFHVVTIGPWNPADSSADPDVAELVQQATRACPELMRPLGVQSIVFPALGTGTAGYSIESSAAGMAEVVNDVLGRSRWPLDVSIMLMSRTLASPMQFLAFYEEFARRVPSVAARETGLTAPARVEQPQRSISDLLELEQERQTLEQRLIDVRQSGGDAAREAELRGAIERNTDRRLGAASREQASKQKAASVFVSYAREDEDLLKKLRDAAAKPLWSR